MLSFIAVGTPVNLMAQKYYYVEGLTYYEAIIVVFAAAYLSRFVFVSVALFVSILSVLYFFTLSYHIELKELVLHMSRIDIWFNSSLFLQDNIIPPLIIFISFFLIPVILRKILKTTNYIPFIVAVTLLFTFDFIGGSFRMSPTSIRIFKDNVLGSIIYPMINASPNSNYEAKIMEEESASKYLSIEKYDPDKENVLIILVESLGVDNFGFSRNVLPETLLSNLNVERKYILNSGQIYYRGSTMRGELRELSRSPSWIPEILGYNGFSTYGFHGFWSGFFNRLVVPAISNTFSGQHRTVNASSFGLQVQCKKVFEVIPF